MGEPIDGDYFNWLCAKVLPPGRGQHYALLQILHETEFVWVVAGDRNREEDGLELRRYFLNETRWPNDDQWYHQACSVLEMLVAFAQRACFQTETSPSDWFFDFLTNLELIDYRHLSRENIPVVKDILHTFIWRTYDRNGRGGIFPLSVPKRDQRKVEIWYQFCDYLEDRGLM